MNGRDARREAEDILGNMEPTEAFAFADAVGATYVVPLHHDGILLGNTKDVGEIARAANTASAHLILPARAGNPSPSAEARHLFKTVLVTLGGAGLIGAYVTRKLLDEGLRVVVYDVQPKGNVLDLRIPEPCGAAERTVADRRRDHRCLPSDARRRRENAVDAIVHLASPLTMDVVANPATGIRDVCLGTNTVFATAREAGIGKVVWTSSVVVYGAAARYGNGALAEDALHDPPTLYGAAKSLCEVMARQIASTSDVDIVGLRLSVVYGAGRRRGYMTYPSALMRDAATSSSVTVRFGDQKLHWQYVQEVADMCFAALMSSRRSGGRVYNAFGDCRSWRDAAGILKKLRPSLQVELLNEVDTALAGVVEDYAADGFTRDYGLAYGWPLERGIAETLDTYSRMAAN